MEQPKRTFKPEVRPPAPRADGLRDRMRTAPTTGKSAPVVPAPPPRPIGSDDAPVYHHATDNIATTPRIAPAPPPQVNHEPAERHQPAEVPEPAPVKIEPITADKPVTTAINVTVNVPKLHTPGFIIATKNMVLTGFNRIKVHEFKRPEIGDNQRFMRNVSIGVGLLVLLVGSWVVYSQTIGSNNPAIPAEVQLKAKFSLFYPMKNDALKVEKNSFKYETGDGLVSFVSQSPSKARVTVSQQAAPAYRVDDNVAYSTLIKSLPGVTSFNTANGKVTLTHPTNKGTPGFAFMASKGTMLIMQPTKTISDSEWQKIFNSFEIVKND